MLTPGQAAIAKGLLARGEKQHHVAAYFGVNGGRIAEISKGARFPDVKPAAKRLLPSPADMSAGHGVYVARQTLLRAKLGIEAALSFLDDWEKSRGG